MSDIPLDKAELLSVVLEAMLYGFSLLMFGGTIWILLFQRSNRRVNRGMLSAALILLVLSTTHILIHMIRVVEGFISYSPTYSSPNAFFVEASQWTFVWENYIYIAETLVGDSVVLYRCYTVWQSKSVMILPVLLWCAAGVTGFIGAHAASKATQGVFDGTLAQLITTFWGLALPTNLLTTILLAWRIWHVDQKSKSLRAHRNTQLRPVLRIILDAGLIYTLTLLAALICFVTKTNGQYVTLGMISPIISITFYMVILRVGLAGRANHGTDSFPLGNTSTGQSSSSDRRNRMEVHVATLTERKAENSLRSPMATSIFRNDRQNEIKLDHDITMSV